MGEANFQIRLDFDDVDSSKSLAKKIRKLEADHDGDLESVLRNLLGDIDKFDNAISIENIELEKHSVYLFAYGGRSSQPPFTAAGKFHQLGCAYSYLRVNYDEGSESVYYIGSKRVNFDKFVEATQTTDYKEIEETLYLPKGRVQVDARLVECEWDEGDFGEFCLMKFETLDGEEFYYKGNSKKLTLLAQDEYDSNCSFAATFEKGYLKLNGPPSAFAKRPTKIELKSIDAATSGAASLSGDSKEYLSEPIAPLILRYLEEYQGDACSFMRSLTGNSLGGIEFSDLMSMADNSSTDQFLAFGLYVCAQAHIKRNLLVECEYETSKSIQDEFVQHVLDLGIDLITEWELDRNFVYEWTSDDIFIITRIWEGKISFEICRRLPVCADGKSIQRQHGEFLSNPSLPSKIDWLALYKIVRNEAEAGNSGAMLVYADLLDSQHAWKKQPEEASKWRERGELAG